MSVLQVKRTLPSVLQHLLYATTGGCKRDGSGGSRAASSPPRPPRSPSGRLDTSSRHLIRSQQNYPIKKEKKEAFGPRGVTDKTINPVTQEQTWYFLQ